MTTQHNDIDPSDTRAVIKQLEAQIAAMKRARENQPERLAQARSDADEARGWSLIEESWESQITAVPAYNSDGERTGDALTIPNLTAKELWGTRLCFDAIDCGDDDDQIDEVFHRYFAMVNGDTGLAFLLFSSALRTVATLVVPQLLDVIENQASDYDMRVMLAGARVKAWNGRVDDLRGAQDDAADCGVRPVDGYDIGANALDPDTDNR
jgi:hypothetical protein